MREIWPHETNKNTADELHTGYRKDTSRTGRRGSRATDREPGSARRLGAWALYELGLGHLRRGVGVDPGRAAVVVRLVFAT